MEAFEYLSVLISIVLGLGITHLLLGFGRWLERRDTFRPFGPSLAWAGFILLVHLQTWWTMFGYREYSEWNFLQFTVVLLQPIVLFLLAMVVFPSGETPLRDLRENFFHQRPWLFGLLIVLLGVSLLKDLVRSGSLPDPMNLGFHGVFLCLAVGGLVLKTVRGQRPIAHVGLLSIVAYITALFFEL
ncbi:MAG: hypothetical protein P8170_17565 [Gemmatimonadota bacterium]